MLFLCSISSSSSSIRATAPVLTFPKHSYLDWILDAAWVYINGVL